MADDSTTVNPGAEDMIEFSVAETEYEFPKSHIPALKALFESIEIEGADEPDIEWSANGVRATTVDEE
ncbi:hypothetical protein [Natrinema sp. DC36]|uniref:hypothetical protein n=1 Tax=Natrinema sp. DC36 TaxID=2878680 RepID=UPI001CEFF8A9|nr:hypothetical protein [Natrinema sp. DC36]